MRYRSLITFCILQFVQVAVAESSVDFEKQVAPILSAHCVRCHSDGISKGDLSLAGPADLRENGYVEPGDPDSSHLIALVTAADDGSRPEMPKDAAPLSADEVAVLRQWIADGASWPDGLVVREKSKADSSWWSLQPIAPYEVDATIDHFIDDRLKEQGLRRNPPADRRTLIRRATYDLTGLPPSPEEIEQFVNDTDPQAWPNLIDRLMASPHYGERWGRHWLDVVRFGESIGFERNVIINNIWPFRDYVIRSINQDKPFDRFIREHLAGDVFGRDDPDVAVGSAFLVAGPYDDVGNQDAVQAAQIRANTLDEIINASSQAFLGLTVGCARCHDHKFDPILQSDYYAFYATFAGIRHGATELATPEQKQQRTDQLAPLQQQQTELESAIAELNERVADRAKSKLDEYRASWTRPAVDRSGTTERFEPTTAKFVRLICEGRDSSIRATKGFGIDEFEVWTAEAEGAPAVNVALASNGGKATGAARHIEDFPGAYAADLAIDGQTGARFIAAGNSLTIELSEPRSIDRIVFSSAKNALKPRQGKFSFVAEYRIEASLDGENWQEIANSYDRKPTDYASNPTHEEHRLSKLEITRDEKAERSQLQKKLTEVRREIAEVPELPSVWIGQRNADDAKGPFHVFLGGSPQRKGEPVVARGLATLQEQCEFDLTADSAGTADESERRAALARWMTDAKNPLTPRVLANRVWQYHFGTGIVDTPSDFGYMGGRPTHPELLDFLAAKLMDFNWQLKPMHRLIMLSETYQQASTHRADAARMDGDARLLWRFPPRRLSAEEIRDTVLAVAAKLHIDHDGAEAVPDGGPGFRLYHFMQDNVCTYVPLDQHGEETFRRAVYHQNARASVVDLMTDFDQPDCAFSTPKRAETTTPLQALTMLNHRFTLDMAAAMADRLQQQVGDDQRAQIQLAYRLCFGREATAVESTACVQFAGTHGMSALCRALLNTSELIYVK